MDQVDIEGIKVLFPFKPYDIQIDYMRCVIKALQQKDNAILESPTGTGKTLSLLCSTLAWLEFRKYKQLDKLIKGSSINDDSALLDEKVPTEQPDNKPKGKGKDGGKGWKGESPFRIIYSSRTHSQLTQACKELKNSYYNYFPSITIGSREQLCIEPEVRNLESNSAKNQACQHRVKNNACKFHHNYESSISNMSMEGQYIYDIEDLLKFGTSHQACPYYIAKEKADFNTSVIFMPYNYVLNPDIRKGLKINLENAVIIFDEGHNIEKVCEDSMSSELRSDWLVVTIECFGEVLRNLQKLETGEFLGDQKTLSEINLHETIQAKNTLHSLESKIDSFVRSKGTKTIDQMFDILAGCSLNKEAFYNFVSICEKIVEYAMSVQSYHTNNNINSILSVVSFIEKFISSAVDEDGIQNFRMELNSNYRIHNEIDQKDSNRWTLHLWCMTPSVAIKSLMKLGVHNIIITSGTLSPLESFDVEMGIPFKIKLQNDHVISNRQLSFHLISKDPKGVELNNAYTNRTVQYYEGLGYTVIELARTVPKGMFIFFASYSLMNSCMDSWKSRRKPNIWDTILGLKAVFFETKKKDEFNERILSFKRAVDDSRDGAIFMAVARGKLSEGIDLSDDYCRAVVIMGLPYPAAGDPKVVFKENYLDQMKKGLTGKQWYMLQMKRALNQSVGRVIRHKADYGTIIMCDSRFRTFRDGLSKWISKFVGPSISSAHINFQTNLVNLTSFFRMATTGDFNQISRLRIVPPKPFNKGSVNIDWNESKPQNAEDNKVLNATFEAIKNNPQLREASAQDASISSSGSIFDTFDSGSSSVNSQKRTFSNSSLNNSNSDFLFNKKSKSPAITFKAAKRPDPSKISNYFNKVNKLENEITETFNKKLEACSEQFNTSIKVITEYYNKEGDVSIFTNILREIVAANRETGKTDFKVGQFVNTVTIFTNKLNTSYLAQRLRYILDNVQPWAKDKLVRELGTILDEEGRLFLLEHLDVPR